MSDFVDMCKLAWRSLSRRRLRAYLTIVGIFIGIASIVALLALGQGLKTAIAESFSGFGPDQLIVQSKSAGFGPPGTLASAPLTDNDYRVVESVPGVSVVAKRNIRLGRVEFNKRIEGLFGADVPNDKDARVFVITVGKLNVATGRMLSSGERGRVILGSAFGETDNPFGKAITVGDTLDINGKSFKVAGILHKTGRPGGDNYFILNEDDMEDIFGIKDTIGLIAIKVAKGADVEKVADDLTRSLRKERGLKEGKEDFTVQTPGQLLSTFNVVLAIVQAVVVGIGAISLLVGGIGVMNTMYTAVVERTRDIGVMKAIGARNRDIFTLFFIESGLLGVVGGLIGIMLGVIFAKAVEIGAYSYFGSGIIRAEVSFYLVIGAMVFSFLVGSVSGTLPALQAARTSPVEALRK